MKISLLTVSFLSAALLFGCSKKTEQTEALAPAKQDQAPTPATQPTTDHHDAKDMHDEKEMEKMNQMMVEKLGPADKGYEDRFMDMMIPHHQSAINMAKDALAKTGKSELKKLAQDIIAGQQKEIDLMKAWGKKWYGHSGGEMEKDMQMMNDRMLAALGPAGKDYEDHFIDEMIPHHEGAIAMAKDALKKTARPELKKMAEDIITAQETEIATLKEWRKKWYGH